MVLMRDRYCQTDNLLSQEIGEVGKARLEEIRLAVADGAREIDIVIRQTDLLSQEIGTDNLLSQEIGGR